MPTCMYMLFSLCLCSGFHVIVKKQFSNIDENR